jgi:hypothetical protein
MNRRAPKAAAGYSGTPLARKLGIAPGARIHVIDPPRPYGEIVDPLPEGVVNARRTDASTGLVHAFVLSRSRLAKVLAATLTAMRPDCVVWISWPKKASGVPTDVTEDVIRELALPVGLVDVKVCAIDATWSGLKLVVRKENR